jgi:centromeric protein E
VSTTDKPVVVREDGSVLGDAVNSFKFDYIADQSKATADVYSALCKSSVQDVLGGINATIFAYGQTSTGKTHTMTGHADKEKGVILLAAQDIFGAQQANVGNVDVEVSYVQIYQKHVTDLLATSAPDKSLVLPT